MSSSVSPPFLLTFSFSFFILLFTKWRTWSIVDIPIFLLGIVFFGATDLPNPLNPQWNNSSLPNIKPKPKTVSWVWSPVLPTCLRVWLFYFPHPTKAEQVEKEEERLQKKPVLFLKSTNTPRKKSLGNIREKSTQRNVYRIWLHWCLPHGWSRRSTHECS